MATTFRVTVAESDPVYARQAAAAAFDELDLLEGQLSRFIESSDISRIEGLEQGESTVVALDTFRCLRIALDLGSQTGGAFDIAFRSAPRPRRAASVELDEGRSSVRVLADGVRVDLGGVGKGYALDRMAALFRVWEIERVLFQASTSTLLALEAPPGEPGWPVEFGPEHDRRRFFLERGAFSASGSRVRGRHIVDPRRRSPARGCVRCWAGAPTAAAADGLSTALMAMTGEEIRAHARKHAEVSVYLLRAEGAPLLAIRDSGCQARSGGEENSPCRPGETL